MNNDICICGHELSWHRYTSACVPSNCKEMGCLCKKFEADIALNKLVSKLKLNNREISRNLLLCSRERIQDIMSSLDAMHGDINTFWKSNPQDDIAKATSIIRELVLQFGHTDDKGYDDAGLYCLEDALDFLVYMDVARKNGAKFQIEVP